MEEAALARELLDALDARRQIAPHVDLTLAAAYRVAGLARDARMRRGERVIGRKIGFTNRTIWAEYGVHAPIWGHVYDQTLHDLEQPANARDFVEPRIEPEIVFGLAKPIAPDMGVDEIARCVGWIAHGFEIVQSLYPGWLFAAPDTVAAFGLHGGLWIGPRRALREGDRTALETFEIALYRDGVLMDRGAARNVLDGPLHALRHLAQTLASGEPLHAGEIVTTGTLTRAFPIAPGELWTSALIGLDLPDGRLSVGP